MAFEADLDTFLADFGETVTGPSSVVFKAIFNTPDVVLGDDLRVMSTQYEITFKTSAISLDHGATVSIRAASYKVREVQKLGDGAFSQALLSKV